MQTPELPISWPVLTSFLARRKTQAQGLVTQFSGAWAPFQMRMLVSLHHERPVASPQLPTRMRQTHGVDSRRNSRERLFSLLEKGTGKEMVSLLFSSAFTGLNVPPRGEANTLRL